MRNVDGASQLLGKIDSPISRIERALVSAADTENVAKADQHLELAVRVINDLTEFVGPLIGFLRFLRSVALCRHNDWTE